MMIWELIHRLVEMLNRTFENVSELDIMINSGLVRLDQPITVHCLHFQGGDVCCVLCTREPTHECFARLRQWCMHPTF